MRSGCDVGSLISGNGAAGPIGCGSIIVHLVHRGLLTSRHYLASHPSWVLSKEQIYEAVWKADPEHCGAAVANVVYSLRRKIGDGYIETVVGSGYRFVG